VGLIGVSDQAESNILSLASLHRRLSARRLLRRGTGHTQFHARLLGSGLILGVPDVLVPESVQHAILLTSCDKGSKVT